MSPADVAEMTRRDKHQAIDALSTNDLRALARHMACYAPDAFCRALAERLSVRAYAEKKASES